MNEKEKIEIDRKEDCVNCKKLEGLGIIAKSDICRNCEYNWYQNKLIQELQAKKELVEALEATVQVLKRLLWINSFLSILTNAEQLINKYKEKE